MPSVNWSAVKITDEHLIRKRKRAYIYFFAMQVIVFLTGSVFTSIGAQEQFGLSMAVVAPIHMGMVVLLNVFMYILVSHFLSRWNAYLFLVFLIVMHAMQFTSFSGAVEGAAGVGLAAGGSFLMFIAILWALLVMVRDVFLHSHKVDYSLLGAANIYWGLGILFGGLYTALESLSPGIMGQEFANMGDLFYNAYSYSWYVIVGIESPFTSSVNSTIRNISILEAAIANLFIIFVVGRLLVKNNQG
jgi:hypothetical protein